MLVRDPIQHKHTFWQLHWKKKNQSTSSILEDCKDNGDQTDPFKLENVKNPTSIEEPLEDLLHKIEAKFTIYL